VTRARLRFLSALNRQLSPFMLLEAEGKHFVLADAIAVAAKEDHTIVIGETGVVVSAARRRVAVHCVLNPLLAGDIERIHLLIRGAVLVDTTHEVRMATVLNGRVMC
jgi:hypothetical protein